jgi:hypothetical protein
MRRLALAALLVAGLAAATGATPAARRYSGTVRAIDLEAGIVVVEELGRRGRPERHEVEVGPDTRIVSSRRLRPHEMRGTSAFGETPVSPADLLVGDYVTVESHEEDGRAVATRITIVELPTRRGGAP